MTERWYFISGDVLWRHIENDGAAFLKKPFKADIPLCSVEEAKTKYPTELAKAQVLHETPATIA